MCEESSFWHRKCYLGATNKDHIQRARDRHEHAISTGEYTRPNRGRKRGSAEVDHDEAGFSGNSAPFLRSSTTPLNKDYCFFCQENTDEQVFKVCSDNAGKSLKAAIDKGHNPILKTRLSTCISPSDAHAIDVRYHKSCWTTHVFHVLRESDQEARSLNARTIQNSCLIELINLVDIQTQNKAYLSMDAIEATYKNMLGPDGLENHYPQFNRQWLKEKILTELPSVKSVLQKNRRKPAVLYSPDACEKEMVESAISRDANDMLDMKAIFKAAQIVRRCIVDFRTETSPNIEVSSNMGHIPSELYTMIRWILVGTVNELATGTRSRVVDRMALTVSKNIMYGFKTNRQVNYCPQTDTNFRQQRTRENPQVRGLALTVHHDTRNKTLMELLNAHGYCISHEQTLRIETALANAVVENTKEFQGLYVPPFLKKGSFVFFAADNSDFSEDTPDGKGTTHGTIVTIYQKAAAQGEPVAPPLKIDEANSLAVLPYHVHMMQCNKPKPKVTKRDLPFEISRDGINKSTQMSQLGWLLATVISRLKAEEKSSLVPCWAGYNSLLSSSLPITQIGALPLLPEVAHEWSTLLTVLMQASQLRYLAVGENHPTVMYIF